MFFNKLLVVLIINIKLVINECEKSFIVTCDSIEDVPLVHYDTKKTWTELIIQCKKCENTVSDASTLTKDHLNSLPALEKLYIISQLGKIEPQSFNHSYMKPALTEIVLYGNDLTTLSKHTFTQLVLKKLLLVNNGIQNIDRNAFVNVQAQFVDLSHNNLTMLITKTFNYCNIEKFVLKHNSLSKVEKNALPVTIKSLHLDFNRIVSLSHLKIGNLKKLSQLSISHNKLTYVSNLSHFKKTLETLDLSHNSIYEITNELDGLKLLRRLDLTANNLVKFSVPSYFEKSATPVHSDGAFEFRYRRYIKLGYNRLRNLPLTSTKPWFTELSLFGNPWNCRCFEEMQKVWLNGSNPRISDCDEKLFTSGRVPFCAVVNSYHEQCSEHQISDEEFQFFQKAIGMEEHVFTDKLCDFDN